MLDNMRHVFKVFEEVTGNKSNKIVTTIIAPKDELVDTIFISYWILDNIDEVSHYIVYNPLIELNTISFTMNNEYDIYIDYDIDSEDKPIYNLLVEFIGYDYNEEDEEEMYRIYRKEGYQGVWHGSFMEPQKIN